jgi:Holliday junction resolvasome RuvABC DNA-binding subunit
VTGSWSSGFLFHHADGSPYGAPDADARKSAILSTVQSCLRGLGFKESEARAGVDRVRPHVGAMSSSEEALRLALSSMPIPRAK